MSDRDQDRDETLSPNGLPPSDGEFDDEPEEDLEGEESAEADSGREAAEPGHRRFGFTLGGRDEVEGHHRPTGSVRESHERVHIDDRASAVYALAVSIVLFGVLILAVAGNFVPQPVVATPPPLAVPTFQATPSASAGASASVAPSASTK